MYKEALILVAKLAFKTHIKYPILVSAAILAATYAFLYKPRPRARPPTPSLPSVDFAEMEQGLDDSGHSLLDCESLASEPSVHSERDILSDTDTNDSSWMDDRIEYDIEIARSQLT